MLTKAQRGSVMVDRIERWRGCSANGARRIIMIDEVLQLISSTDFRVQFREIGALWPIVPTGDVLMLDALWLSWLLVWHDRDLGGWSLTIGCIDYLHEKRESSPETVNVNSSGRLEVARNGWLESICGIPLLAVGLAHTKLAHVRKVSKKKRRAAKPLDGDYKGQMPDLQFLHIPRFEQASAKEKCAVAKAILGEYMEAVSGCECVRRRSDWKDDEHYKQSWYRNAHNRRSMLRPLTIWNLKLRPS